MSSDQSQPGSVGQPWDYQARQWMAAFRRGDRDTFDKVVSDFDYRVAAYLLKRGLPAQQSSDLARDTLRAAWRRLRAGETPTKLWPWLVTIADDLLISHSDHLGDKIPDGTAETGDPTAAGARSALDAFAEADSVRAQQRVAWQYASDLVKFLDTVVQDLPAELQNALSALQAQIEPMRLDSDQHNDTIAMTAQRTVVDRTAHGREALDMVQQIAGLHFMARPGAPDCTGFTACLMQADWEYRQFGAQLPTLREHVNTCTEGNCRQNHADATALAGQLPVAILFLILDRRENRRQLVEMIWAAKSSAGTEHSATTAAGQTSAVPAAPAVTEAPRLAETASTLTSSLVTRFAQLPWIRPAVEALQQHPMLAQYLTRGVAGAVALAVAGGIVVGTFGLPGSSADTDSDTTPSSTIAAPTPGVGPGSPGAGPGSPGAGPGSPGAGPGSPGAGPGSPGTGPGSPGTGPGSPGTGPGSPGAGPGSPGTIPRDPASSSTNGPEPSPRPTPSTVPAKWGFGFVRWPNDAIGSSHELSAANPESNWTFGLWRLTSPRPPGKPTVTHVAVGRHRVRLPAIGAPGGIVHVTATDFSAAGSFCQPYKWGQDGADEVIDVACFDPTGHPADVPFGTLFVAGTADNPLSPGGLRGFAYANSPTAATYTPEPIYRRNVGAVARLGTGRYTIAVPNGAEAITISPVDTAPRHCAITDRHTESVELACMAHGGVPADTAFTFSYAGRQNLLDDRRAATGDYLLSADTSGAAAPSVSRSWSSTDGPITLARQATGKYEIHFPSGYLPSSTHVTAVGVAYCNMPLRNDIQADNVLIRIACFTATGVPTNGGFHLIYMSAR